MKQNTKLFAIIFLIASSLAVGFAGMYWLLAPDAGSDVGPGKLVVSRLEDVLPQPGIPKLVVLKQSREIADFVFQDGQGGTKSLKDWRGKVIVVNLWATWCAPCKVEMPTLDRLQAKLGAEDFAVITISLDRSGPDGPRRFLEAGGLKNLPLFIDETGEAGFKLKAAGLPTTLIIGRDGREIARLAGTAEWDSAPVIAFLQRTIAGEQL